MQRSVVELEAELERVAVLRGRSAENMTEAMTAYYFETRTTPTGRDPQIHRRAVLTELILAWARTPTPPRSDSSIAELEAVFLRMSSPLDVQERRWMLHDAKNRDGANADSIHARLLSWIDAHGFDYESGDPGAELAIEDD